MTILIRTPLRQVGRLPTGAAFVAIQRGRHTFHFSKNVVDAYDMWQAKERSQLQNYIAANQKKLANQGFIDRAPVEVVAEEQKKLADAQQRLLSLTNS
mgnify:CR=1 FL=1